MDTVRNQYFDPNSEVSLTQGLLVYFWCGMRNWAVEYNVAELSFAVHSQY